MVYKSFIFVYGTGTTGLMIFQQNLEKDEKRDVHKEEEGKRCNKPDQSKSTVGEDSLQGYPDTASARKEQEIYVINITCTERLYNKC